MPQGRATTTILGCLAARRQQRLELDVIQYNSAPTGVIGHTKMEVMVDGKPKLLRYTDVWVKGTDDRRTGLRSRTRTRVGAPDVNGRLRSANARTIARRRRLIRVRAPTTDGRVLNVRIANGLELIER